MIKNLKISYFIGTTLMTILLFGCGPSKEKLMPFLNDFVKVEGGRFMMGSADSLLNRNSDEVQHQVEVSTFHIQNIEVTNALYELVTGDDSRSYLKDDYHLTEMEYNQMPVTEVSWEEVQLFITKLNEITGGKYRLPTEAEWEFAARGGNSSKNYLFSGSNWVWDVAWYYREKPGVFSDKILRDSDDRRPREVKLLIANELGIYDMSGNVREWCSDWYGPYNLNVQHAVNPKGAENGSMRICRGGGWKTSQWDSDVFFRDKAAPNEKSNTLGFRLVYSD